jgi:hypothetical protein
VTLPFSQTNGTSDGRKSSFDRIPPGFIAPLAIDLFAGLSYSAVTKVNTRFSDKLRKDKKLRRGSQEILGYLSHVKA